MQHFLAGAALIYCDLTCQAHSHLGRAAALNKLGSDANRRCWASIKRLSRFHIGATSHFFENMSVGADSRTFDGVGPLWLSFVVIY